MAGVRFEAHYNVTSVDPPELVRFIKKQHPEVSFDIPHDKNGKPVSMWTLLKNNSMPPTQVYRYCCRELKESTGSGTVCITGVRWAESVRRKNHQGLVTIHGETRTDAIIMNDDNDEARRTVEVCFRTKKTLVNPIIDWSDDDVWEFIRKYNVPYCELYDRGYKRLGCIGCPMGKEKGMRAQFEAYPKYKEQYMRCFNVMLKRRKDRGLGNTCNWQTGQDLFEWWIKLTSKKPDPGQISMADYEEEEKC